MLVYFLTLFFVSPLRLYFLNNYIRGWPHSVLVSSRIRNNSISSTPIFSLIEASSISPLFSVFLLTNLVLINPLDKSSGILNLGSSLSAVHFLIVKTHTLVFSVPPPALISSPRLHTSHKDYLALLEYISLYICTVLVWSWFLTLY